MLKKQSLLLTGALSAGLAVALGAFGAHALKDLLLENGRESTYELAVRYQFYHALALLIMGTLMGSLDAKHIVRAGLLMTAGMIVFSGSLYILSLSGIAWWGAVTPFGGALLIAGWIIFIMAIAKGKINGCET